MSRPHSFCFHCGAELPHRDALCQCVYEKTTSPEACGNFLFDAATYFRRFAQQYDDKLAAFGAMKEALESGRSVIYDTQQACLFVDDYGGIGVSEDAVISSYHFDKLCKALDRIDAALRLASGEERDDAE